jgi:hypothetical protein
MIRNTVVLFCILIILRGLSKNWTNFTFENCFAHVMIYRKKSDF